MFKALISDIKRALEYFGGHYSMAKPYHCDLVYVELDLYAVIWSSVIHLCEQTSVLKSLLTPIQYFWSKHYKSIPVLLQLCKLHPKRCVRAISAISKVCRSLSCSRFKTDSKFQILHRDSGRYTQKSYTHFIVIVALNQVPLIPKTRCLVMPVVVCCVMKRPSPVFESSRIHSKLLQNGFQDR